MSTIYVDNLAEKTSGAGVKIAGHVIQVVEGSTSTPDSTSSTSVVDSGLTATITPKFSTSKILATASIPHHCVDVQQLCLTYIQMLCYSLLCNKRIFTV